MREPFAIELEVRDYECDLQGVVNNAVYQHYLEHARHVFLKERGIDFAALAAQGINLVVIRAEVDYLAPLHPGERFRVTVTAERVSRLRFGFRQEIVRLADGKTALRAFTIGTGLMASGRPGLSPELEKLLGETVGWDPGD